MYQVGGTEKLTVNLVDVCDEKEVTVTLRVRDEVVTSTSGIIKANTLGILVLRVTKQHYLHLKN